MTNLPPRPKGTVERSTNFPTAAASIIAIDWTTKGKVGAIKDQGQCGSCWAFSAVGAIESNVAIKKSAYPVSYSEQQLVDCCFKYGFCNPNGGCKGAWPANGLEYVGLKGLTLSAVYPYTSFTGVASACKEDSFTRTRFLKAPYYNEIPSSSIAKKLQSGPLSVCVDGSKWNDYGSGVLKCSPAVKLNHAAVLVGVDSNGTWKLRNSWGTSWGENGYIRVSGDPSYNCGITEYASFPILA